MTKLQRNAPSKWLMGTMLGFGITPAELQSFAASESNGCGSLIMMMPPLDASAESPGRTRWIARSGEIGQPASPTVIGQHFHVPDLVEIDRHDE
jgi:hypothetical protein